MKIEEARILIRPIADRVNELLAPIRDRLTKVEAVIGTHASADRVADVVRRCAEMESRLIVAERAVDSHRRHLQSLEKKFGAKVHSNEGEGS